MPTDIGTQVWPERWRHSEIREPKPGEVTHRGDGVTTWGGSDAD